LHVEDEAGPAFRGHRPETLKEQLRDDLAEGAQAFPVLGDVRAQQLRQGEHILAVRDGGEDVLLDPFAVGEHALLVAARAEVARLAGEGE